MLRMFETVIVLICVSSPWFLSRLQRATILFVSVLSWHIRSYCENLPFRERAKYLLIFF